MTLKDVRQAFVCVISFSAPRSYSSKISTVQYYTVQLSSKVTFARVSDASRTRSGRAPVWRKRGVAHTYVLLQLYREVLRLHGRVSRASQTRPARVSDAFGRYLGAELYCTMLVLLLSLAITVATHYANHNCDPV